MNLGEEIISGRLGAAKNKIKVARSQGATIRVAQDFAATMKEAISLFENIERLIQAPDIDYVRGENVKMTTPANFLGGGRGLVVIFSICEDPQPISAWIEEVELDVGNTGYE